MQQMRFSSDVARCLGENFLLFRCGLVFFLGLEMGLLSLRRALKSLEWRRISVVKKIQRLMKVWRFLPCSRRICLFSAGLLIQ